MYNSKRKIQLSDTVKKLSFGKNFILNKQKKSFVCGSMDKFIEVIDTFSEVHPTLRNKLIEEITEANVGYRIITIISYDKFEVVIFYGSVIPQKYCNEVIIM